MIDNLNAYDQLTASNPFLRNALMPLFSIAGQRLGAIEQANFSAEKKLQYLVESNLQTIFNCRFVASEFPTGAQHAGRIDTLALSEDDNPVIIEYKKVESAELITQGLYYLSWIDDHHGDFEIAVQKALGSKVHVDWADIRVICIAPNYKKFDLHAAQVTGANIELWSYRLFKNEMLYLEEILQKSYSPNGGNGKMTAGKKAAITRANGSYTFEQHLNGKPQKVKDLALAVQEFVMGLDPAMEEAPKKQYIAYKISQNIVCMELRKERLLLFLKLNPREIKKRPSNSRDVSKKGHFGTGDLELEVSSMKDVEAAKQYLTMAYHKVGG